MLKITNIEQLARILGVSSEQLRRSARRVHQGYFEFPHNPGNGKASRMINAPAPWLKEVQAKIYIKVLKKIKISPALHGGVAGRSILTNALQHAGKKYLINLDIRKFFPSISFRRVFRLFHVHLGYPSQVARILTELTMHERELPQGAPTSCAIANLVSHFEILPSLLSVFSSVQCNITAYIDDVTVSSDDPQLLKLHVEAMEAIESLGFRVHPIGTKGKNEFSTCGSRQQVNGLVVNRKPNLSKVWVKRTRARIHHYRQVMDAGLPNVKEAQSIKGLISFARTINPRTAEKLNQSFVS